MSGEELFLLTKLAGTCEHSNDAFVSNSMWLFKVDHEQAAQTCYHNKSHQGFACKTCNVAWCNICGAMFHAPDIYKGPA